MSFDISVGYPAIGSGDYVDNPGPIFKDAIAGGIGLYALSGMKCAAARPVIVEAIWKLNDWPKRLNYDYDGAIRYLKSLIDECDRHPDATIMVDTV